MTWQTVGFEKNKKFFESVVNSGYFAHSYIFSGQSMIGKKTFALELARNLTGSDQEGPDPDILLASAPGIEGVREIKNFASLGPYAGNRKIIIVDEAHQMNTEAQNALLKLLEEPSPSSFLILVTPTPGSVLPTIFSRCQEVKFTPHKRDLINLALASSKLSETNKEFLAEFAGGRIGLIKKVMEDDSFEEIKASIEDFMRLVKLDINGRFAAAQKLADDKHKDELECKVFWWMLYARMRFVSSLASGSDEPKAAKLSRGLLNLHGIISHAQFNTRLALENFLVQL